MAEKKVKTTSRKTKATKKKISKVDVNKLTDVEQKNQSSGSSAMQIDGSNATETSSMPPSIPHINQTSQSSQSSSDQLSSGKVVSWIALVLSLIAASAAGYAWYLSAVESKLDQGQQQNRFSLIEQRVGGLDQIQTDLSNQISQLRNLLSQAESNSSDQVRSIRNELINLENALMEQLGNSEKRIHQQSDAFRQEFDALSNSIANIRDELGRSLDSWTLEEAEQLVFIANQRIKFAGEVDLAREALQLADRQLSELSGSGIGEVRKLIAENISDLNNITPVDVTSVLNSLAILSDRVDELPLSGDIYGDVISLTESETVSSESDNQVSSMDDSVFGQYIRPIIDAGADLLSKLGDLIQVEKSGQSVKPVVSAEVRRLTYEKVKLTLEAAQIAFIRQQSDIYFNRIQSARDWVNENFDMNHNKTIRWLNELAEVGVINPSAELPDLSPTLDAVRSVVKTAEE